MNLSFIETGTLFLSLTEEMFHCLGADISGSMYSKFKTMFVGLPIIVYIKDMSSIDLFMFFES